MPVILFHCFLFFWGVFSPLWLLSSLLSFFGGNVSYLMFLFDLFALVRSFNEDFVWIWSYFSGFCWIFLEKHLEGCTEEVVFEVWCRTGELCRPPCENGGRCLANEKGDWRCYCWPDFSGERCEVNHCTDYCLNGGTCMGSPLGKSAENDSVKTHVRLQVITAGR